MTSKAKKQSKPRIRLSHDPDLAAALKELSRDEVLDIDVPLSEVALEACWFGVYVMRAMHSAAKSMDPPVETGGTLRFAVDQEILAKFGMADANELYFKVFREFMHNRVHAKAIRKVVEMNRPEIARAAMQRYKREMRERAKVL